MSVSLSLKKNPLTFRQGLCTNSFPFPLCQSKHYVSSRHFQEYLFSQNFTFTYSLTKQQRWTSSELYFFRGLRNRMNGLLFALMIGLSIKNFATFCFIYCSSLIINLHCWGLIRSWEGLWTEGYDYLSISKHKITSALWELINTAHDERLLTKLGKVEPCSRGRSYTGARGKRRVGSGVLEASSRVGA
jgi:hypothetical protein